MGHEPDEDDVAMSAGLLLIILIFLMLCGIVGYVLLA